LDFDLAHVPVHSPVSFGFLAAKNMLVFAVSRNGSTRDIKALIRSPDRGARMPELMISPEKSLFDREAREFDVKEAATDLDSDRTARTTT